MRLKTLITATCLMVVIAACRPSAPRYVPPIHEDVIRDTRESGQDIQDIKEVPDVHVRDITDTHEHQDTDIADGGIPTISCTRDQDCGAIAGFGDPFCTVPVCGARGICVLKGVNNGVSCKTDDLCVKNPVCDNGLCTGEAVDCDDHNLCTTDYCEPEKGCVHRPNNLPCNDGNPCTSQDFCQNGSCKGFNNTCQCASDRDCKALDDTNKCNGSLICKHGVCVTDPSTVVHCPASKDQCKQRVCQPDTGKCVLVTQPDGTGCDDGNRCTLADTCIQGRCVGHVTRDCDDNNACTRDLCLPDKGCVHQAITGTGCDDHDPCTADDRCTSKGCRGTPIPGCGCTDDTCCEGLFSHLGGDLCQAKAIYDGQGCRVRILDHPKVCDPLDNPCKLNECDPSTGKCVSRNMPDGRPCKDGNPCHRLGVCENGECQADPKPCNTPPQPECIDGKRLRKWDSQGKCDVNTGSCEYSSKDITCKMACSDGKCVELDIVQMQLLGGALGGMKGGPYSLDMMMGGWFQIKDYEFNNTVLHCGYH